MEKEKALKKTEIYRELGVNGHLLTGWSYVENGIAMVDLMSVDVTGPGQVKNYTSRISHDVLKGLAKALGMVEAPAPVWETISIAEAKVGDELRKVHYSGPSVEFIPDRTDRINNWLWAGNSRMFGDYSLLNGYKLERKVS